MIPKYIITTICLIAVTSARGTETVKRYWFDTCGKPRLCIDTFLQALSNADLDGLLPEDYDYSRICKLLGQYNMLKPGIPETLKACNALDRLMSSAFLRFNAHQRYGVAPHLSNYKFTAGTHDTAQYLDTLGCIIQKNIMSMYMNRVACRVPIYLKYKQLLSSVRDGRMPVDSLGKTLIEPLYTGYPAVLDTRQKMELAIRINMERCRWLSSYLTAHRIEVNIPSFDLDYYKEGNVLLHMKVIVGTRSRQTQQLYSRLQSVILHPYWSIPPKIASGEILPIVRRNPGYLTSNQIEVYRFTRQGTVRVNPSSVNWCKVSSRHMPYTFRQAPGPKNPLGRIKFVFDNPFMIYMHDTPHKQLFNSDRRAFSHGCIRLEKPQELAALLLQTDTNCVREMLQIDSVPAQIVIPFTRQCEILVTYLTIKFDRYGNPIFLEDIYRKDAQLALALGNYRK